MLEKVEDAKRALVVTLGRICAADIAPCRQEGESPSIGKGHSLAAGAVADVVLPVAQREVFGSVCECVVLAVPAPVKETRYRMTVR